jgi:hypothetical protein
VDTCHYSGAATELLKANLALFAAVQEAVSPETMVIADALAWEDRRRAPDA